MCDSSDPYIAAKRTIDILTSAANDDDKVEKDVAFKNNALFRHAYQKLRTHIQNSRYLDIVMPMYDLSKNSDNYFMTSGSLRHCYRDEIDVHVNDSASDGKSFKYKAKIVRETPEIPLQPGNPEDTEITTITTSITTSTIMKCSNHYSTQIS